MQAICSSETSVYFQRTPLLYIPEDRPLYDHCRENFYLEVNLNHHSLRVVIFGNFSDPGSEWVNGGLQANSYYYIKIRGHIIRNTACYFGLCQYSSTVLIHVLLDLVVATYSDNRVSKSTSIWLILITVTLPWLLKLVYGSRYLRTFLVYFGIMRMALC
jgi:hypothetical protein